MNTLTKKFVKRALSAFLSVLIVFSLFTVGFTSASAADVDVAETGADTITVYFQNNWQWTEVKIYCWDSNKNALIGAWRGTSMDFCENDGTYDIYKYDVPSNAAGMVFSGIKNDGSGATDQSPDITDIKTGVCYYMTWNNGNQVGTFDYKTTTLTDVTASVAGDGPFTIGDNVKIKATYAFSDSSDAEAYPDVTLYNSNDEAVGTIGKHTPSECEITVNTATLSAGEHTYKVKVSYGELSETKEVTFTLRDPLSATLSVTPTSGYVGSGFVFTVSDNAVSDEYGTPVYALYKEDGTLVESTWNGNSTTIVLDTSGEQNYYATVTVEGYETVTTATIPVTVNALTDFGFTVTYPSSVQAGETITITASLTESVPYPVTYVLTNTVTNEKKYSETGKFSFVTETTEIGSEKTFTLTAYATVGESEVHSSTTKNITVAVTEITETHTVTIYFKSTDTRGYLPIVTVTGMKESKVSVPMEKAALITGNKSGTAQYWWYKVEIEVSSINSEIYFKVLSERYDMQHEHTFYATNSEYWFVADNLNASVVVKDGVTYEYPFMDVSDWPEAKRNWTQSASHMLWDDEINGTWPGESTDKGETAEVGAYETVFIGDANNDGVVNIKDATYIQKSLAGLENADYVSRAVSDVDGDSMVTIKDATALQKKLVVCL